MSIWRGDHPLILASQSRARQTLLANAGIGFEAMPAEIDERSIQQRSGLSAPADIAALLAREKAQSMSSRHAGHHVIGADQTLALEQKLFNKPANRAQAFSQLQALAGRTHALHSAVAIALDGRIVFEHVATAELTMRALRADEIEAYVEVAGEVVTSSVGAYQLERLGVHLFTRINGDHFTILGLPLLPLLEFMRGQDLLAI